MTSVVAPSDRVRADINSAAPSAQTLRHLRAILGCDQTGSVDASQRKSQKPLRPQKPSKVHPAPKIITKGKDQTTNAGRRGQTQIVKDVPKVVGQAHCRKLATEVFNTTLKQLGLAAKAAKEFSNPDEGDTPSVRLAPTQRPLQEQSPNRKKATGRKDEKQVTADSPRQDWTITAECALSALQYLIDEEENQDVKRHGALAGLENASLILLDRTITLALVPQAESHAIHIFRQYWRCCPKSSPCSTSQTPSAAQQLLGRSDAANDHQIFGYTTSMQSQILRLIIQMGPTCINRDLINSLKLDTVGSPSWLCLQGLEHNLQNAQQTGNQLRTISLAISRLYSLAIASKSTGSSADNLYELFCVAMAVKFASWEHLRHKLDPRNAFWRHFTSATKRYIISAQSQPGAGQTILRWIRSFQQLLKAAGQDIALPSDLHEILLRAAGQLRCESEIYSLSGVEGAELHPIMSLISGCQMTSSRLSNYRMESEIAVESVSQTREFFSQVTTLSIAELERILLPTVQLRKALLYVLREIQESRQSGKSAAIHQELETSCFHLIFICVSFLSDRIRNALVNGIRELATDRKKTLLSTLLKNADSMIQLEKCSVPHTPTMPEGRQDILQYTTEMAAFLHSQIQDADKDEPLSIALTQIQVRLSQAYWNRYIQSVEARSGSQNQVQILEKSIISLTDLSLTDQKSAFLGLKYQRLASCYADLHDFKASKHSLEQSIDFDIKLGALRDATESSLTAPSHLVWFRADSSCVSLGKSLTMFANVVLAESAGSEHSLPLYDSNTLPPVQRAVMLEKQVCCLLERTLDEKRLPHLASQLTFLLSLLDQPMYRVFRLRLVSALIATRLKNRMGIIGTVFTSEQIRDILKPAMTLSKPLYLQDFESSSRTILQLQLDISTGQLNSTGLQSYLKLLGEVIMGCKTSESLRKVLDDPDGLISLLLLCVGYANMLETPQAAHASLEMMRVLIDHGHRSTSIGKAGVLILIARSHQQLQNTESGYAALCAAQTSIDPQASDKLIEIELALAFAEYYFTIQDFQRCSLYLDRARSAWECRATSQSSSNHKIKLREQTLLCASAYLTSQLAFHQGNLLQAATCARQSVKVIAAVWLSISKGWQSHGSIDGKSDSGLQSMVADFTKLDISSSHASGQTIPSAAIYWQEASLHCSVFSHMASLLAHCGLYCDAVYFYEQGLKVANQANMPGTTACMQSELALLYARAGQHDKAKLLHGLHESGPRTHLCLVQKLTVINQAEVHVLLGETPTALELFEHVRCENPKPKKEIAVNKVKSKTARDLDRVSSKRLAPKPRKETTNAEQQRAKTPNRSIEITIGQKTLLNRLAVLQARLSLCAGEEDIGLPMLSLDSAQDDPRNISFQALSLVRSALKLFSDDSVNNVLAETAVALPVRYKSSRKSGRISLVQEIAAQDHGRKPSQRKGKASDPAKKDGVAPGDGRALLLKAYQSLTSLRVADPLQVPSETVHCLHKLLSQTALLSTALGDSLVRSSIEILADALSPLDQLRQREVIITSSEKAMVGNGAALTWPTFQHAIPVNVTEAPPQLGSRLKSLPESWSVVSIGLTQDRTELLMTRMSRHRSPFVLRIPLTRPDPSAMDHEELDFASAKAELENIVIEANTSAHDSRGSSADKAVRKAWFAERQSLDGRLACLLDNIENIWFGGFRGLFSAKGSDDKALARFGQSLSNTLNRHLPSRQKSSKAGKAVQIELHSHVLELFLTLGHPRESDLEDSVIDLMYFVVDVLQFHGENNAYDEIDFDAILVEVLDALHAYHEEASSKTSNMHSSHLILVVDKELQAFPWESLPCVRGESVSRMPSLGAIWERLETMGPSHADRAGYTIPASEGTYILNPSSDLVSTEDTFKSVFEAQLPKFTAIVDRAPSETEFETALQDSPLVLYFGHGGGAQYIRGRTIRKLPRCAVTLLMGCSSVKLSECGVYESYGMPWNYINGGSAAVVGTLWDVTDRDIDRFAMEMMSGWGLVDKAGPANVKDGKRKATKDRTENHQAQESVKMSLDQAVARSRDVCLLKYLNGAAPVMYGIPVFLE